MIKKLLLLLGMIIGCNTAFAVPISKATALKVTKGVITYAPIVMITAGIIGIAAATAGNGNLGILGVSEIFLKPLCACLQFLKDGGIALVTFGSGIFNAGAIAFGTASKDLLPVEAQNAFVQASATLVKIGLAIPLLRWALPRLFSPKGDQAHIILVRH